MHGEGSYYLGESYIYRNGMMVNNYPSQWPFKMSINENQSSTLILTEEPSTITVDIVDSSEETNRVEADCGRSIRLRCGTKTDQPTSDSLPTPLYVLIAKTKSLINKRFSSGFHVNLIPRGTKPSATDDRPASPANEQPSKCTVRKLTIFSIHSLLDMDEKNEPIEDSILTVSDNGQAQFVAIDINTFAVRPRKFSTDSQ